MQMQLCNALRIGIDLVITDQKMPEMKGVDYLEKAKVGDQVVLGPAQGLHPFAVMRPASIDRLADGRGADKTHCVDQRMVEQGIFEHPRDVLVVLG